MTLQCIPLVENGKADKAIRATVQGSCVVPGLKWAGHAGCGGSEQSALHGPVGGVASTAAAHQVQD